MIYGTNGSTLTRCNMQVTYIDQQNRIYTFHAVHCYVREDSSLVFFYIDIDTVVSIPIDDVINIEED